MTFLQRGSPTATSLASAPAVSLPVQCAWCRRWRADGQWTAERPGGNVGVGHAVSHGICPECVARQLADVAAA
jgi:hypothetical protein